MNEDPFFWGEPEGRRPVFFKAVPFADDRAATFFSDSANSGVERSGTSATVRIEHGAAAAAIGEWRFASMLRGSTKLDVSASLRLVNTPRCARWSVRVEGSLNGARQMLAWTADGVRTFLGEKTSVLAPVTLRQEIPFTLALHERRLRATVAGSPLLDAEAGLTADSTGDYSVQLFIAQQPECPREILEVSFGPMQVNAD